MGCAASKPEDTAITTGIKAEEDPTLARSNAVTSQSAETFALGGEAAGITIRYACMSQRGYNPTDLYEANQDAYCAIRDMASGSSDDPHLLLGVFDGAGGEGAECAQYVRKEVGGALESALQKSPGEYTTACKTAMLALNQQLIVAEEVDASYSGTCALTAWFHGRSIHVCNVRARARARALRCNHRTRATLARSASAARGRVDSARAHLCARAGRPPPHCCSAAPLLLLQKKKPRYHCHCHCTRATMRPHTSRDCCCRACLLCSRVCMRMRTLLVRVVCALRP